MRKLLSIITVIVFCIAAAGTWAEMHEGLSLPKDLDNYKHAGSLIIPDKNSPLFGIHHFYMNKKGMEAFQKGTSYPDGSIIVGNVYEVATTPEGLINDGKKRFNTYMQKDSNAKETGGWLFAAFSPDGKMIEKDVKTDCFVCHTAVKDSDYVFSKPLK